MDELTTVYVCHTCQKEYSVDSLHELVEVENGEFDYLCPHCQAPLKWGLTNIQNDSNATNLDEYGSKFLCIKHEDISKYLTEEEQKELVRLVEKIDSERALIGKPVHNHLVITEDEPYLDEVIEIMKYNGALK